MAGRGRWIVPATPFRGGSRIFVGGGANPYEGAPTYIFFFKISQILHEIKKILDHMGAPGAPSLGSANVPRTANEKGYNFLYYA